MRRRRATSHEDVGGRWVGAALAAAMIALLGVGIGCNGSATTWDEPGPTTTFERFLMHWFKGDQQKAFEMIRPEDREALTGSLEFVEEKVGSSALKRHEMLVAGRVDNPYDLKDIEVEPKLESKPESGQRVTLSLVYHDGRSAEAAMVWSGDRWYVDLPLDANPEGGAEAGGEKAGTPAEQTPKTNEESDPAGPSESPDAHSGDSRE